MYAELFLGHRRIVYTFYAVLLRNGPCISDIYVRTKTSSHLGFSTSNTSISVHPIRVWMVEDLGQLFSLNPEPKVKPNEINHGRDFYLRGEIYLHLKNILEIKSP